MYHSSSVAEQKNSQLFLFPVNINEMFYLSQVSQLSQLCCTFKKAKRNPEVILVKKIYQYYKFKQ